MNLKKILIVEDEIIIAKTIQKYLSKKKFEFIEIATTFKQAIDYLDNTMFDLVLLDINLNETRTGIDIANVINDIYQIPFVYISSYFDDFTIDLARVTKPAGFITKPINKDTLYTTIEMIDFNFEVSDTKTVDYLIISERNNTYRMKFNI